MAVLESLFIGNPEADKQAQIETTKLSTGELQREVAGDIRVVTGEDFQKAYSSEKKEIKDEPPFTPEEMGKIKQVKAKLTQLREAVADSRGEAKREAQQALDDYRETADCQQVIEWYKEAVEKAEYEKNRKFDYHDERDFRDETIDATVGKDIENSINSRLKSLERIRITQFVAKQEGLMSMDRSFQAVLDNPQYDGAEVVKNEALNKEVYEGFSPEVQEAIKNMHIKIEVRKYDQRILVYFVYGLNDKGEEVDVKLLDNGKGENHIYVLENKDLGKILSSQYKGSPYNQQIREKEGIIEKIVYVDGTAKSPYKVQKLPASNVYAVNQ